MGHQLDRQYMFAPETYARRRNALRKSMDSGIVLMLGNDAGLKNHAHTGFPFRQDKSFLYYFGLDRPGLAGIIDVDQGIDILFGNDPSLDMVIRMGNQPSLKEQAAAVGIERCDSYSLLEGYVKNSAAQSRAIHFLPPYRSEHKLSLFNLLDIHPDDLVDCASKALIKAVVAQREAKTEEEVSEIDRALTICAEMHIEAIKAVRPGMMNSELAVKVFEVALVNKVQPAFPLVATLNGQALYNPYQSYLMKKGDLLLLDAGAETQMHYTAGLSTTFPVDKVFTDLQKQVYNVLLRAHASAIDQLGPGTTLREVHAAACRELFAGLKELGLTRGDTEEAVQLGAHALFSPSGTKHMAGLDSQDLDDSAEIHKEAFGLKSLGMAKRLGPGFVLTLAPGIYFIPELIAIWKFEKRFDNFLNYSEIDKLCNFGRLRIKEVFLITEKGGSRLGKYVPRATEELEALRH